MFISEVHLSDKKRRWYFCFVRLEVGGFTYARNIKIIKNKKANVGRQSSSTASLQADEHPSYL